VAVVEG